MQSDFSELVRDLRSHHAALVKSVMHETDRGMALVYAAFLDECLEKLLKAHFKSNLRRSSVTDPLFEGFGPLANFSGRIRIAYSFTLIGDAVHRSLETIRKLRNAFAHELECTSFDEASLRPHVELLFKQERVENYVAKMEQSEGRVCSTRECFEYLCLYLGGTLHAAIIVASSDTPLADKTELLLRFGEVTKDITLAE